MAENGAYIESVAISYPQKVFQFGERYHRIGQDEPLQKGTPIRIGEHEYIKALKYKQSQGFITTIELCIANNHKQHREVSFGNGDERIGETLDFVAKDGYQLAGVKCTRSTYLLSIECKEELLSQFQPVALVSSLGKNQERYINNYYEIKKLQNQIPKSSLLDSDSEYSKLFIDLNLEIEEIIAAKNMISDDLQEVKGSVAQILSKYRETSIRVESALKKSAGRFSLKEFKDEYKALESHQGTLDSILEKFNAHESRVKALRLKDPHKRLKLMLTSSEDIINLKQSTLAGAGLAGDINKELEELQETKSNLQQKQLTSKSEKEILLKEIASLELLVASTDEQIKKTKEQKGNAGAIISSMAVEDLEKFQGGSEMEKLEKLQQELEENLEKLQKSYDRRKELIKDKIQKEVDKIESHESGDQQSVATPLKNAHIIIIADESGSMSGNWASVRQTVDSFVQNFAATDDLAHLFSVILFDNSCRYHAKREKASDVLKLPDLASGGTCYGAALEMGADFAANLTPQGYSPIILFMTDGEPTDGLQKGVAAMQKCSKLPNFIFFAVGFGGGYRKDTLQALSDAGNNGKQGFVIGSKQIKFIYDAVDGQALQEVFDNLTINLDFAGQESAIKALDKQLQREENEFTTQSHLYNSIHETKVENLKEQYKQMSQYKDLSMNQREESYNKLLDKQLKQSADERLEYKNKLSLLHQQKNTKIAAEQRLTAQIELFEKKIKDKEERLQNARDNNGVQSKTIEQRVHKLQMDTGFTTLESLSHFQYQLSHVEGLLNSQMIVIKDTRNVLKVLKTKLFDLCLKMKPSKQKSQQKQIDTYQLEQGLKLKYPFLQQSKEAIDGQIIEVLKVKLGKDFEKNVRYFRPILDNIDLISVSIADNKELKSIAKKISREMIVRGKGSGSDSDSDSGSSSSKGDDDSDGGSSGEEDLSAFLNSEITRGTLPQSQSEIRGEVKKAKDLKKKLKKEKKSDQRTEDLIKVDAQLKFLVGLQDINIFQKNVANCLKKIRDVTSEVFGSQLKQDLYDNFKITFSSFGTDAGQLLNGLKESIELFKIEGLPDLEKAVNENKYGAAKAITAAQPAEVRQFAALSLEM